MQVGNEPVLKRINPGSRHEPVIDMQAGVPLILSVYTTFSEDDLMPHDWSLVAWAEQEAVFIVHEDGLQSASFRYLERDDEIPAPQNFANSTDTENNEKPDANQNETAVSSEPLTYDELDRLGYLAGLD